jgi:hypothetical protein
VRCLIAAVSPSLASCCDFPEWVMERNWRNWKELDTHFPAGKTALVLDYA